MKQGLVSQYPKGMSGRLVHELEYYSDGAFGDAPHANIIIRYYKKMDRLARYKLANSSNFTVSVFVSCPFPTSAHQSFKGECNLTYL